MLREQPTGTLQHGESALDRVMVVLPTASNAATSHGKGNSKGTLGTFGENFGT